MGTERGPALRLARGRRAVRDVFQTRSQWDTVTPATVGQHIGTHVLLVDVRFVLLSVCCTVFMCARVYLQNQDHHDVEVTYPVDGEQGGPRENGEAELDVEDMVGLR